jgi:ketosteroid isomerase-like protein
VLAEWTIRTSHRASGATVEWTGMSTCAIDDGRIRWWHEYWDPRSVNPPRPR